MKSPGAVDRSATWRRAIRSAAVLLLLAFVGCEESTSPEDDNTITEPPPVPTVTGVDKTSVEPGDTLVVTGSDFDPTASENRVRFSSELAVAVPFEGSGFDLHVVVPRDALTGAISVTRTGQPEAAEGPEVTVTRSAGAVWVQPGDISVEVATPPGAQYLVIPYAANPGTGTGTNHQFTLNASEIPPAAAALDDEAGAADRLSSYGWTIRERFEAHRWREADAIIEKVGVPEAREPEGQTAAPAAPQETRTFNVLNTTTGSTLSPGSYAQVTAELRYTGTNVLVYTDLDTLETGNLTFADIKHFGERFDDDIRPSNTKYFGAESDVDNNDKVIILVTPVVNRLTPPGSSFFIGGFFLSIDLFAVGGGIPSGTTNHAEIFYVLAADPGASWGNTFPTAFVADEDVKTIVHEYEHLISFSHRIFQQGGVTQQTWLEEGMAHMAEDLLAIETGEADFNTSNESRGASYRGDPSAISLEDDDAPISQRGGIYMFLRLLGDRYGEDIYKAIVQNDCKGRACIADVTGEDFYVLLGDFLAALYLDNAGGTPDPRYDFTTITMNDFGTLLVTNRTFDGIGVVDTARRASGAFYLLGGSGTATSRITVDASSSAMGLRTLIMRTQ
jgi:hypothetical protein